MVVDGYRTGKAARVHIDPLTIPVALETHWNNDEEALEQ
jgi:hypothetical protein